MSVVTGAVVVGALVEGALVVGVPVVGALVVAGAVVPVPVVVPGAEVVGPGKVEVPEDEGSAGVAAGSSGLLHDERKTNAEAAAMVGTKRKPGIFAK